MYVWIGVNHGWIVGHRAQVERSNARKEDLLACGEIEERSAS